MCPHQMMTVDADHRGHVRPIVFERVADQVLHELTELQRVGLHTGQVAHDDAPLHLLDASLQVRHHLTGNGDQVGGYNGCALVATRA